jgi:hypothetical protein
VTLEEIDHAVDALGAGALEVDVGRVGLFRAGSTGGEIELAPVLDGPRMDERVSLAIVYFYLAVVLEAEIYEPKFQPLRDVLRHRTSDPSAWRVAALDLEWLPEPRHAIIGRQERSIAVDVRFFRCAGWRVELPAIHSSRALPAIFLDMLTGEATYSL